MSLWFYFTFVWYECSHGFLSRWQTLWWHLFLEWSRHMNPPPPFHPPPGLRPLLTFLMWGSAGCCTTLILVKSFNVEIHVAICFWTGWDRSSDAFSWVAPTMEVAVKTKGHHCHSKEITSSQVGLSASILVLLLARHLVECNLIMW